MTPSTFATGYLLGTTAAFFILIVRNLWLQRNNRHREMVGSEGNLLAVLWPVTLVLLPFWLVEHWRKEQP